jgi:hypothetical protein
MCYDYLTGIAWQSSGVFYDIESDGFVGEEIAREGRVLELSL